TTQNEESSRLRQSSPYVSLYQVAEEKLRWKELTRPVDEVLSPEGIQYGEVTEGQTHWDLCTQKLRAEIENELSSQLDRSKGLLFEGGAGELYMGKVLTVSENFVVQEVFCNTIFVHLRKEIDRLRPVEEGQYLKVHYGNYSVALIE